MTMPPSGILSERRKCQRHKAPNIVYIDFASGNGGIVTDLGLNGLAFQAAYSLGTAQKSVVDIRLKGGGLNTRLQADVVWVGPTGKEAGLRFRNVSIVSQKDIADWITRQTTAPARSEERSLVEDTAANSFKDGDFAAPRSSWIQQTSRESPVTSNETRSGIPDAIEKYFRLIVLAWNKKVLAWNEKRKGFERKKLIAVITLICVSICFAVLATIQSRDHRAARSRESSVSTDTQGHPLQAPTLSHSGPFSALRESFEKSISGWRVWHSGLTKEQDGIPVWTSKRTGYYYCADSAYYQVVQPGALVSQGRALQSGYQPKLGQACN